ncbi:XdhC family protein [Ruegeria marina]|uniref:Xanthine dehydrogenase accessory factor n=1 Tax=Ruegeria marina TaxID=639004 RepID=A0A1G6UVE6_9RHOB|nr:XdhC family protein [Ruegeria marina]SDD45312.1 xanthine dehydrogenase accessory factor [Ruegeria marina]
MIPAEILDHELASVTETLRASGAPFAIATVIRTLGQTAAKPGAKALLSAEGDILHGWVGGGCVRGALARAARQALAEGIPQLISLMPEDLLAEKGLAAGEQADGTRIARNGCPSRGSMDIFVEPILPLPELVIYGASPVAQALARLAPQFDWNVTRADPAAALPDKTEGARRMIVVATQGQGDAPALKAALAATAEHLCFVGSRRKFAALRTKFEADGTDPETLDRVNAPAGLAIDAVTPEEIALSILARLIQQRRHKTREARS